MPVRLNIDLGELPDEDERLFALAELANLACGGHAGDEGTLRAALERCRRHGAQAGAHPSYLDPEGFGRRDLKLSPAGLRTQVLAQCRALGQQASALGVRVGHLKPHGALYHRCNQDEAAAAAVLEVGVEALGELEVLGAPGGALQHVSGKVGLVFLREGFADRGLLPDGRLIPRGHPGALLEPQAAATQATRLAQSGAFDTVCVHGDSPHAVEVARAVRAALDALRSAG
jgi:5-oxoprolinase (ATP-hydrolysing) subunit A